MDDLIRQQMLRRWELKCALKELEAEKAQLEKELFPLYIAMHNEQVDVENLESKSIRNWFLDATGKKEAMLMKERREAQTAKLNHDTVLRRLEYTGQQLEQARQELEQLRGSWDGEENRDLILRELKAALETGNEVLADSERMLGQIDNLIEQNKWGMSKSMMPSYLATAQKKINLLKRKLELFGEEASNLPVSEPVLEAGTQLLVIDEHLMDEVVAGLGADMVLGESHSALAASKKRIQDAITALETGIRQLES